MQSFRVIKLKPRKSSKPAKSWSERRIEIAAALESDRDNVAMVACSECVNNNVVCYYDREQSVKCAACLRHQRNCDGTFSLEEFRKVGVQKKELEARSLLVGQELHAKRQALLQARRALLEAESCFALTEEEDLKIREELARVKDKSNNMLRREMKALGVLDRLPESQEIALADPDLNWSESQAQDFQSFFDSGPLSRYGVLGRFFLICSVLTLL